MALRWAVLAMLAAFCSAGLAQQNYPARPIRVVMPVPPGAGVDTIVRKAGEALAPRLGQGFVVDNRASSNMVTGADACAKSAPDAVVKRLNEEFARLFKEPSFIEFLDSQMVDIVGGTPEEFARFIAEDRLASQRMVQKYNIPKQ